jgi:hypothetical protein
MSHRLLIAVVLAAGAMAQQPKPPTAQLDEMKKASFLLGRWKGSGTMEMAPGQRHTFNQTEDVESKLGGLLVVIQGEGKSDAGRVGHQAFAVLSYQEPGGFHFRSWDQFGRTIDAPATFKDGTFVWSMQAGPSHMRYTIHVGSDGQWREIGEMSMDGTTWRKFFEMTLDRVK